MRNSYNDNENEFSKCKEYFITWLSFQDLWNFNIKPFISTRWWYGKMAKLMTELKEERKSFDDSESEKIFGTISTDYSVIQSKIINKSWPINE